VGALFGHHTSARLIRKINLWFKANSELLCADFLQTDAAPDQRPPRSRPGRNTNGHVSRRFRRIAACTEVSYSRTGFISAPRVLAQHIMGPCTTPLAHGLTLVNMPTNQKALKASRARARGRRAAARDKTSTLARWMDVIATSSIGVAMYDALDGFVGWMVFFFSAEGNGNANGGGPAIRMSKYITFETGNTHQQNTRLVHNTR